MDQNQEAQSGQGMQFFGMNPEQLAMVLKAIMDNKDEAKAFVGMFTPVIHEAVDLLLDTTGPVFEKVVTRIAVGTASVRKATFDAYIGYGFTREEAMQLILNDISNQKKIGESLNESMKGSFKK